VTDDQGSHARRVYVEGVSSPLAPQRTPTARRATKSDRSLAPARLRGDEQVDDAHALLEATGAVFDHLSRLARYDYEPTLRAVEIRHDDLRT
jgi:hypothetical protein